MCVYLPWCAVWPVVYRPRSSVCKSSSCNETIKSEVKGQSGSASTRGKTLTRPPSSTRLPGKKKKKKKNRRRKKENPISAQKNQTKFSTSCSAGGKGQEQEEASRDRADSFLSELNDGKQNPDVCRATAREKNKIKKLKNKCRLIEEEEEE